MIDKARPGDRVLVDLEVKAVIEDKKGISYQVGAPNTVWNIVVEAGRISENIDAKLERMASDYEPRNKLVD